MYFCSVPYKQGPRAMTDREEDLQLVQQILEKNSQNACTRLVNKYRASLFQFMADKIRSGTETEDLMQEVFAKVFRNLASFNPRYAFSTWLYNIANHSCIDYLRKKGRITGIEMQTWPETFPQENIPHEDRMEPEPYNPIEDVRPNAKDMSQCLPEKYRQVFELRYVERLKYRQIAETTGLPMGTVKTHLFRAKAFLNANAQKADTKDA